MKKQVILAGVAVLTVCILFIFGRTTEPKKGIASPQNTTNQRFNIQQFITEAKQKLTPSQSVYLSKLENNISRGDVPTQQIAAYTSIAGFWKDSIRLFDPYAYYTSEAAKLDNSEKNLTFAAQLILNNLRGEQDEAKLDWQTNEAINLFERAIVINPDNDDLKIGLGSCYVFGKGRNGDPQQTMKGIQTLLAVVKKDSANMKAQLVLGIGGFISGQYDKAIERLKKVLSAEPDNLEAIAFLADVYAAKGEKEEAIKWYTLSKRLANNPHYSNEVDNRIKMLK